MLMRLESCTSSIFAWESISKPWPCESRSTLTQPWRRTSAAAKIMTIIAIGRKRFSVNGEVHWNRYKMLQDASISKCFSQMSSKYMCEQLCRWKFSITKTSQHSCIILNAPICGHANNAMALYCFSRSRCDGGAICGPSQLVFWLSALTIYSYTMV